jgi:hypothetical protein
MADTKPRDVMEWTQMPGSTARADYHCDQFGWMLQQAELLRAGRLDDLDRHSLAELLTDMAASDRRAFEGAMRVLLQHRLKVLVQPEKLTRTWLYSIAVQQVEARSLIEAEPGMRPFLPGLYDAAYADARRLASVETGIALARFPAENPWSMDEALADVPPTPAPRGAKRQKNRSMRRAAEAGIG